MRIIKKLLSINNRIHEKVDGHASSINEKLIINGHASFHTRSSKLKIMASEYDPFSPDG